MRQPSQLSSTKSNLSRIWLTSFSSSIDSLRKLHRKASNFDASFDPRTEPTATRAVWDKIRDDLERGMGFHILNCGPEPIAVAEANIQQAFVDILNNEVIRPLVSLEVSQGLLVHMAPCSDNRTVRKGKGVQTRKQIEEDLNRSAASYADYAENAISKLQQEYFKKYHPR